MQKSPTLKHGDGESPVRGKKTCLAVAIAGVLGLMSGTVSAASTFIHSEHYVSGPDSMVAGVLHEEHFVTKDDAPTDDEMGSHPEADSYGIRLQSVFLMPVYNFNTETGTQTTSPNEFTVENADWTYRLVNDPDFGYSIGAGVVAVDHKVTFNSTGEKANFRVTAEGTFGSGPDATSAAIFIESSDMYEDFDPTQVGTVNLDAKSTTISAVATGEASASVHGVNIEHYGALNMNGDDVTISVSTESNLRPTLEPYDEEPFESFGIYKHGFGTVTTSEKTVLNINVTGTGNNADNAPLDEPHGAENVAANIGGIYSEGGTLDLRGETNITVEGNGNWSTGLQLWSMGLDVDDDEALPTETDQTTIFGGNATISVTSEKSQAVGLLVGGAWFNEDADEAGRAEQLEHLGAVTVTAEKDLTITAKNTDGTLGSIGIGFNVWGGADATVNLKGKTVITADQALAVFGENLLALEPPEDEEGVSYEPLKKAVFNLNNSGTLTLNGNVDGYTGTFTQTAGSTTLNTTNGKFFGGKVALTAGDMIVNGGMEFSTQISGNGNLTVNGNDGNIAFNVSDAYEDANGHQVALNNLTIANAAMTNSTNMEIADTITLTNVKIDNLEDGDVEAKKAIVLGEGTVLRNYGHFDSDNWILLEGSKYLEAYEENDPEFTGGNMIHDSGRVEFAGGLYGLVSDENALKSWTVQTDREEANAGDDYSQPQLVVSAGDYSWDYVTVDSTATEGNALEVSGGSLTLDCFNAQLGRAAITGGKLHADTLNSTGAFTMNVSDGTFTIGKFVGAEGGAFTLTSGVMQADEIELASGLLTVNGGATLSTFSGEIFSTALSAEGTTPEAGGLLYGSDRLSFASKSTLTLRDQFYNESYRDSALSLLGGIEGGVYLTFTGKKVNAQGEVTEESDLGDMAEGVTETNTTIKAEASDGTVSIDKSVGGKELVVDENTTSVAIANDKTFTLVGSENGGELITFENGADTNTVEVSGGLALGTQAVSGKGTISTTVSLASGSNLTSQNGEYAVSTIDATNAQVDVASGSLAVSNLKANGGQLSVAGGTLSVENLTLSGSTTLTSGSAGTMELVTVQSDGGEHQLKGEITAGTVSGTGTLLVGSAEEEQSASSTLAVANLEHKGVIFIDPAWTDGAEMKDGSFLTVEQLGETGELKAQVVAGQHSTFSFGATKDEAVKAFAETKLSYGEKNDVTALLYVAKPVTVTGGSITVDGGLKNISDFTAPEAGSVFVAKQGLAMFDGKAMEGLSEGQAVLTAKNVSFEEGSHIRFTNLTKDSEGTLIDADSLDLGNGVLEDAKSTNSLISVTLTDNGDGTLGFTTELKDAAIVFEGFKGAGLMNAMHEASANDTESNDRATRFLSRMAEHGRFGVESADDAVDIGNQAMALAATAGVYNVALDASDLMNRSLERRMTLADNFDRTNGVTVWADVFGTTNEAESLYGDGGYDMDLYGGVLGADVEVVPGAVLGAALTVGTGDGGSKSAAIDVDNDADFFGLSVYGSHRIGSFNGMADIGWMHTKSDLSATAFGIDIGDEVKADAFTIGLGAEYLTKFGSLNVVPHVGIRWTRLDVDGYEGAFETDDDTMNVFTLPIGVAFSGNFNAGGWKLAPMVDLAVVPSFGDDEAESKVYWQGVSETVKTQVVDDAPFRASLGINAQNGNWTIGASYDLGVGGDDRLDNAFTLRARYAF